MSLTVLFTSEDESFFDIVNGPYLQWRREGLPVRLSFVQGQWLIVAPTEAAEELRDALDRVSDRREDRAPGVYFEPIREFEALMRLKRGEPLARIAANMPNLTTHARGVSEKSAEIIVRGAIRVLLSGVLCDRRPPELPDELWPPAEIRDDLRYGGESRRSKLLRLRAWVEGRATRDAHEEF